MDINVEKVPSSEGAASMKMRKEKEFVGLFRLENQLYPKSSPWKCTMGVQHRYSVECDHYLVWPSETIAKYPWHVLEVTERALRQRLNLGIGCGANISSKNSSILGEQGKLQNSSVSFQDTPNPGTPVWSVVKILILGSCGLVWFWRGSG